MKISPKISFENKFKELDGILLFEILDQFNLVFRSFAILLIFWNSADFDCCIKLINKKEVNINFFEIPEINVTYKV